MVSSGICKNLGCAVPEGYSVLCRCVNIETSLPLVRSTFVEMVIIKISYDLNDPITNFHINQMATGMPQSFHLYLCKEEGIS